MSGRSALRHSGSSVAHNSPVCETQCVCIYIITMCVCSRVVQTPLCYEKVCVCVCVYAVYACLLAKQWPQLRDIKLCPSSPPVCLLPSPVCPPPTPRPPIWTHRGPLVPETPCSRPVLMSPGPANSFNHLLIPKAGQAD